MMPVTKMVSASDIVIIGNILSVICHKNGVEIADAYYRHVTIAESGDDSVIDNTP
jgi:hypothetical protein